MPKFEQFPVPAEDSREGKKEAEEKRGSGINVEKIVSTLKKLLQKGANKDEVAQSLAGIGTPEAIELREKLLQEGVNKDEVAQSLAELNTPEAMEMREILLKKLLSSNPEAAPDKKRESE